MNSSNQQTDLSMNLVTLRKRHHLTQEMVAEAVGVTRQAIAKWENGDSVPDILHCDALAALYNVSLDNLVHFNQQKEGVSVPPKGKHLFGTVQMGERGQIVVPKKARDLLGLKPGDTLVVLGESNPATAGIALMHTDVFMHMAGRAFDGILKEDEK